MKRFPLDAALGTPAKVAVLRVLSSTKVELTGRETARLAGVSVPQAINALNELAKRRIVLRRQAGRAGLYAINDRLDLVKKGLLPLFRHESQLIDFALTKFRGSIGDSAVTLALFGSRARSDSHEASDVDLLVVLREANDSARDSILRAAQGVSEKTGLHVSPLMLTLKECRNATGQKKILLETILKEGRHVAGKPLGELLHARRA